MSIKGLEQSDKEAAAVQKTEHRVTLDSMKEKIVAVNYVNPELAPHFTIAVMKMQNGYIVLGQSAPADPANYNKQYGEEAAFADALRKVWALEGYALCNKLAA